MRKTTIALTLVLAAPLAALAADKPAAPRAPAEPGGWDDGPAHMEKRMRLARTLGLAEALDLNEAEAMKVREVLARHDEKREPLRKQMREAVETLRKAARGDAAAQKGVDDALKKMREVRGQALALRDELFQQLTQGFGPEKKARAALFMARFRERMGGKMGEVRERVRELRIRRGPGGGMGGPGMGGPGGSGMMGPGGPGAMGPGPRMGMGPDDLPEPPAFAEGPDFDDDDPI